MNYTTNYHLPQWVESDRIMMEDFNDAMASIETGLSESAQASCVTIDTSKMREGDIIYTFPKAPKFVVLRGTYVTDVLVAGSTVQIIDFMSYQTIYAATVQLSGNQLILVERTRSDVLGQLMIAAVY